MPTSKYLREGEAVAKHEYDRDLGAISDQDREYARDLLEDDLPEENDPHMRLETIAQWFRKVRYEAVMADRDAYLSREATLISELNKLVVKHSDTLNELDKAVLTIRDWHTAALKMRDLSISGKADEIERVYFDTALGLPFYGAQGAPLPSERKPTAAA